ncbi:MAG: hypothetical protein Q4F07_02235 [Bacteroidales bacterium]|nr:hypothetical protein [Bacteroidales bacterium]
MKKINTLLTTALTLCGVLTAMGQEFKPIPADEALKHVVFDPKQIWIDIAPPEDTDENGDNEVWENWNWGAPMKLGKAIDGRDVKMGFDRGQKFRYVTVGDEVVLASPGLMVLEADTLKGAVTFECRAKSKTFDTRSKNFVADLKAFIAPPKGLMQTGYAIAAIDSAMTGYTYNRVAYLRDVPDTPDAKPLYDAGIPEIIDLPGFLSFNDFLTHKIPDGWNFLDPTIVKSPILGADNLINDNILDTEGGIVTIQRIIHSSYCAGGGSSSTTCYYNIDTAKERTLTAADLLKNPESPKAKEAYMHAVYSALLDKEIVSETDNPDAWAETLLTLIAEGYEGLDFPQKDSYSTDDIKLPAMAVLPGGHVAMRMILSSFTQFGEDGDEYVLIPVKELEGELTETALRLAQ